MRRIFFLFTLLVVLFSYSQNKQILYGFSEVPQSLLQNPGGKFNNDWYVGIPLLSHVHFNAASSGISTYDLFADDGVDFNVKLESAIYSLKETDFFSVNEQFEIFSGGFALGSSFKKDRYISFGMYQEFDFIGYFPKDLAILAYEGNQGNIGRIFDVGEISFKGDVTSVFHVGYNKIVNDKFTFGFRGKIYSSIANVTSTNNKGRFVTTQSDNNFYNHIFRLDLEVRTSGINSLISDENSDVKNDIEEFKKRILFGGNLGLGFDVGFTYNITDQWTVDGSLLDVGFINHSKDIENHVVEGEFEFEGVDPLFDESVPGQTADDYWSNVEEEFEDLFEVDSTTSKYATWRPVKLNASLNYAFGKKKTEDCNCTQDNGGYLNATGAQLYVAFRPKGPQLALTAYYYRRLFNGLSAKATYTVDTYSFSNIGLGVSANIGGLNFYFMADNFLEYKNIYNTQSVSLQLGFNYIFNKNED